MQLISIDPFAVSLDQEHHPDRDESHIYDHLKYYCSKLYSLPAITVRLDGDLPVVVRGHKYLGIARDLGHASIRAIVERGSDAGALNALLKKPGVVRLDPDEIDHQARSHPVIDAWHVFFFERPLNEDARRAFENDIIGFFERLESPLLSQSTTARIKHIAYSQAGFCGEFKAFTPVADERWPGAFFLACALFSVEHANIVSYQGRRFSADKILGQPSG